MDFKERMIIHSPSELSEALDRGVKDFTHSVFTVPIALFNWDLSGFNFSKIMANHFEIWDSCTEGIDFSGAVVHNLSLYRVTGSGMKFNHTDARALKVQNSNIPGSQMQRILIEDGVVGSSNLSGSDISGGWLKNTAMLESNLSNVVVRRTRLEEVTIYGGTVEGTKLEEATIISLNIGKVQGISEAEFKALTDLMRR